MKFKKLIVVCIVLSTTCSWAEIYVSNLGNGYSGSSVAVVPEANENSYLDPNLGISFTTGSMTNLQLDSVDLDIGTISGSGTIALHLYSDTTGSPGSKLSDFSNPETVTALAANTFTLSSSQPIEENTTYWLILTATGDSDFYCYWKNTAVTSETSSDSWTIADTSRYLYPDMSLGLENTGNIPMFSVNASIIPEPATICFVGFFGAAIFGIRRIFRI